MKPQLLKISKNPTQSFTVRRDLKPSMNNKFHYHPELELLYIAKGEGTQVIGDRITRFQAGDLLLVGPNLPHYWRFDEHPLDEGEFADVIVVHFSENFLGRYFLDLPENKSLKDLLEKSKRGIKVEGNNKAKIIGTLKLMFNSSGTDRIIYLVHALFQVATSDALVLLSSAGYAYEQIAATEGRIQDIFNYTLANYRKKIHISEVAEIASISPNCFCRYFKTQTQKTYLQFLIEVRVGNACRLLLENKLSVKQICYESGFNNFSSFHKCFKEITGESPLSYRKELAHANQGESFLNYN